MHPIHVPGFQTGLQRNIKPNVIAEDAFQTLNNAYIEDGQVRRRAGLQFLGRLRRAFTAEALGNTTGATTVFNIFTVLGITETNAELEVGSVVVTVAGPENNVFTDASDGTFTITGAGSGTVTGSYINYVTGDVSVAFSAYAGASAVTVDFAYFPSLPVMGIYQRELTAINDEQTIFFDNTYAYSYNTTDQKFQELASTAATTWTTSGTSDFFWGVNWRGINPQDKLFFATNFISDASNPMRYYNGTTWADFVPAITTTGTPQSLFQAKILLPYYGRLIALNVYEGATADGAASAVNIFNRCTFSQIGDPLATDAWYRDEFGKGGFIDAPINEAIVSARFFKSTLIVFFERSTWQLRYVGEFGIPFLWERIDSDLGCESTFSPIQLEQGVLAVGDKAIIGSTSTSVDRIDEKIKNLVFSIMNTNSGHDRVIGAREFQKELIYWCYGDGQFTRTFPNRVLVFNYNENNWSVFRDNVTFFGLFQDSNAVSWDSLTTYWDDDLTLWDDFDTQSLFPFVVCGNQEGFVHKYNQVTPDERSLSVTAIDRSVTPPRLTVVDHNLEDDEIVYLENMNFVDTATGLTETTDLNTRFFQVHRIDDDTLELFEWDTTVTPNAYVNNFSYIPANGTGTYVGGGTLRLFPVLNIVTKDFNPFQNVARQVKFVKGSFIFDTTEAGAVAVNTFSDVSDSMQGNIDLTQNVVETSVTAGFDAPQSDFAAHAFYASTTGQFVTIQLTWNDTQMNDLDTQNSDFVLNSMSLFFRPGGKMVF